MEKSCKIVYINNFIYVLSDDEIKGDDYYLENGLIYQAYSNFVRLNLDKTIFKIIACTDNNIGIKLLPSIPQSFIDKYVSEYNKGNKIEEVMVEHESDLIIQGERDSFNYDDGKKLNINVGNLKLTDNTINIPAVKESWSKDEVIELCENAYYSGRYSIIHKDIKQAFDEWIEDNL